MCSSKLSIAIIILTCGDAAQEDRSPRDLTRHDPFVYPKVFRDEKSRQTADDLLAIMSEMGCDGNRAIVELITDYSESCHIFPNDVSNILDQFCRDPVIRKRCDPLLKEYQKRFTSSEVETFLGSECEKCTCRPKYIQDLRQYPLWIIDNIKRLIYRKKCDPQYIDQMLQKLHVVAYYMWDLERTGEFPPEQWVHLPWEAIKKWCRLKVKHRLAHRYILHGMFDHDSRTVFTILDLKHLVDLNKEWSDELQKRKKSSSKPSWKPYEDYFADLSRVVQEAEERCPDVCEWAVDDLVDNA